MDKGIFVTFAIWLAFIVSICQGACFSNTSAIRDWLATLPAASPSDADIIELCPQTIFAIGGADRHPPLMARSNTYYQCGPDAKSNNACILLGGEKQLWSPRKIWSSSGNPKPINNMLVQGITFESADGVAILLESPGDVTFLDCIIQNHINSVPVLLKHSNPRRSLSVQGNELVSDDRELPSGSDERALSPNHLHWPRLDVSFEVTKFLGNSQESVSSLFTYGIISALNPYNDLTIMSCKFENNDYTADENGYLIRTMGSSVTIEDSWFLNNKVSGWGLAEFFSWDLAEGPVIQNNDGVDAQGSDSTGLCPFAAFSETIPEIARNVKCLNFNGTVFTPILAPSASPVTKAPFPSPSHCHATTQDVADFLTQFPPLFPITVELCPFTVYTIGRQDASGAWVDGDPPLFARSLTTYKCGSDGMPSDHCVLRNGAKQFWSENTSSPLIGVSVQGITFENATEISALLEAGGDVAFVDCIFQNHVDAVPVLATASSLQIDFVGTIFRNNEQQNPSLSSTYGVITSSDSSQNLTVSGCAFYNNAYYNDEGGYLVRTLGSSLSVEDSMFSNNTVSGWGLLEVFLWSETNDPYVRNNEGSVYAADTSKCPFLALSGVLPTLAEDVECLDLNGSIEIVPAEVAKESNPPSFRPSGSPSTEMPTSAQAGLPTDTPSPALVVIAGVTEAVSPQDSTEGGLSAMPVLATAIGAVVAVAAMALFFKRQIRRQNGPKDFDYDFD
ncbi:hypothetical protein ACA910_004189 [Epithemia clementina (nom. ined.)]